jgi:hypothetical protein
MHYVQVVSVIGVVFLFQGNVVDNDSGILFDRRMMVWPLEVPTEKDILF